MDKFSICPTALKSTLNDGKLIQLSDEDLKNMSISTIERQYKNHFDLSLQEKQFVLGYPVP